MRRTGILLAMLLALVVADSMAQPQPLTLEWAYQAADEHSAIHTEAQALTESGRAQAAAVLTGNLPAVFLNGQAVYHSEVAELPFTVPGATAPSVPHDQYKVGVGMEQVLYGRALITGNANLLRASSDLEAQWTQISRYRIRDRVETAYFAILFADAQLRALEVLESDIGARLGQLEAAVRRGVARQTNVDVLRAELARLEGEKDGTAVQRESAMATLGLLTGHTLQPGATLQLPAAPPEAPARPEWQVFEATRTLLQQQADLSQLSRRPVVKAFGEAAVGQPPGLNLFENAFQPFFSVGVRLNWRAWDWRSSAREQEALEWQGAAVDARESDFREGVAIAEAGALGEIRRIKLLLERDPEIIELRARITADAASRLEAGVATATDYLIERNAEHQARLSEELHRIQLARARARHATVVGSRSDR